MTGTLSIHATPHAVADRLAEVTTEALRAALATRARATLCLTGGSTPEPAYERLGATAGIEWDRIHLFWCDERAVGPDDAHSNFGMVARTLLRAAGVPASNVHRIEGELGARRAALAYESTLEEFFGHKGARFDVLHLGMGADAHVASLFPGAPELDESRRRVVPTEAPRTAAVRERITLTLPVLNRAQRVFVAAAGADKGDALAAVDSGDDVPAARLAPEGPLVWIVDRALAQAAGVREFGPADAP